MASFGGLILSRDPGEHLALASLGGLFLSRKHLILGTQAAIDRGQLDGYRAQFGRQKIL
jgi:hypothetical protein